MVYIIKHFLFITKFHYIIHKSFPYNQLSCTKKQVMNSYLLFDNPSCESLVFDTLSLDKLSKKEREKYYCFFKCFSDCTYKYLRLYVSCKLDGMISYQKRMKMPRLAKDVSKQIVHDL